jgi:hypothetical protein
MMVMMKGGQSHESKACNGIVATLHLIPRGLTLSGKEGHAHAPIQDDKVDPPII